MSDLDNLNLHDLVTLKSSVEMPLIRLDKYSWNNTLVHFYFIFSCDVGILVMGP